MMQVGGLVGFVLGIVVGLSCLYLGKRKLKRNRGDDEMYRHVWQKTRSISWYATTVAIYALLFLVLIGVDISTVQALSILLIVHLFSWAIVGIHLSSYYYNESEADAQIFKFGIGMFAVLGAAFILLTIFFL